MIRKIDWIFSDTFWPAVFLLLIVSTLIAFGGKINCSDFHCDAGKSVRLKDYECVCVEKAVKNAGIL